MNVTYFFTYYLEFNRKPERGTLWRDPSHEWRITYYAHVPHVVFITKVPRLAFLRTTRARQRVTLLRNTFCMTFGPFRNKTHTKRIAQYIVSKCLRYTYISFIDVRIKIHISSYSGRDSSRRMLHISAGVNTRTFLICRRLQVGDRSVHACVTHIHSLSELSRLLVHVRRLLGTVGTLDVLKAISNRYKGEIKRRWIVKLGRQRIFLDWKQKGFTAIPYNCL